MLWDLHGKGVVCPSGLASPDVGEAAADSADLRLGVEAALHDAFEIDCLLCELQHEECFEVDDVPSLVCLLGFLREEGCLGKWWHTAWGQLVADDVETGQVFQVD